VFGCEGYAHVPKEKRRKLNLKTQKCLMIGCGEVRKGYRLLVKKTGDIVFSRDVVFDETEKARPDDSSPRHQAMLPLVDQL
jgi:hypothetical protein